MGIGPAYAIPMALKHAGLKLSDMDVIEVNEAFAVQNLAVIMELEKQTGVKIDMNKWNPNGGAIAFSHPNERSGARICIFAMKNLFAKAGNTVSSVPAAVAVWAWLRLSRICRDK